MTESSFSKGFGGGCGLILGVTVALSLIPLVTIGGCIMLGIGTAVVVPAAHEAQQAAQRARNEQQQPAPAESPVVTPDPADTADVDSPKSTATQPNTIKDQSNNKPTPATPVNRLNLANYNRIKTGMTYKQVKAIFGPATEELASNEFGRGTEFAVKTVMLMWKGSMGANSNITFQNGLVTMKAQFGLPAGKETPDYVDPEMIAQQRREREAQEKAQKKLEEKRHAEQKRKEAEEAAKWRTWTDSTGKHTIEASYKGLIGNLVVLKKRDGKTTRLPIDKLSSEDQKWIADRKK